MHPIDFKKLFVLQKGLAYIPVLTSVQAGAVLMPLAMFLLSLKSIEEKV